MTTDVAKLVLAVDASQLAEGGVALDKLTVKGKEAEQQAVKLTTATSILNKTHKDTVDGVKHTAEETQKLLDKYDPLTAKVRVLNEEFKRLSDAAKNGKIAVGDMGQADAAMSSLKTQINGMSKALNDTEAAARGAAHGSSMVTRELIVMGHEALSGNFSRIPGSFMSMLSYSQSLRATLAGLAGTLAVVATLAAPFVIIATSMKAANDQLREFNSQLIQTNNRYGTTAQSLQNDARQSAGDVGVGTGATAETMGKLMAVGGVEVDMLGRVSAAAVALEDVGGRAIEKSVEQFKALGEDPVQSYIRITQASGTFDDQLLQEIQRLSQLGDNLGAARLAQDAYTMATLEQVQQLKDNMGGFDSVLHSVKEAFRLFWEVARGGGSETDPMKLVEQADKLLSRGGISAEDRKAIEDERELNKERAATALNEIQFLKDQKNSENALASVRLTQLNIEDKRVRLYREMNQLQTQIKISNSGEKGVIISPGEEGKILRDFYERNSPKETTSRGGVNKEAQAYTSLTKAINEHISAANADFLTVEKQTVGERLLTKVKSDLATGVITLTAAHRANVFAMLASEIEAEKNAEASNKYNESLKAIKKSVQDSNDSLLNLSSAQKTFLDLTRDPLWERMPDLWKETAAAQMASAHAQLEINKAKKEFADIEAKTPTVQLEKTREQMQRLADAYLDNKMGTIGSTEAMQKYAEMVDVALGRNAGSLRKEADALDEFTKSAAGSMQKALADFLFDPFKEGLAGMAQGFGKTIQRMVADAVSADLLKRLFGDMGKTGEVGGWVGKLLGGFGGFGGSAASSGIEGAASFVGPPVALAGFAVGTDYVPHDMVAQIHQGEKIIPAAENKAGRELSNNVYNLNIHMPTGSPAESRRAAGAGAREALAAFSSARRYS